MDVRPAAASHPAGYVVVLLGVVGFVVSCFLPFYGGAFLGAGETISLYDSVRLPGSGIGEAFAGRLYLFVGAGTVGVVAIIGIARPRTWAPYALVAAVAAWALTWLGALLNQVGLLEHGVGYWTAIASLAVAVVGTIVVWVSTRSGEREPEPSVVS